jgi:hypothetical protein
MTDRPTRTSGQQRDWTWSDRIQNRTWGDPEEASPSNAALRREIRELRIELEQSEYRVQSVIDHYERLLAERERRLDEETDATETDESLPFLSAVLWWRDS